MTRKIEVTKDSLPPVFIYEHTLYISNELLRFAQAANSNANVSVQVLREQISSEWGYPHPIFTTHRGSYVSASIGHGDILAAVNTLLGVRKEDLSDDETYLVEVD